MVFSPNDYRPTKLIFPYSGIASRHFFREKHSHFPFLLMIFCQDANTSSALIFSFIVVANNDFYSFFVFLGCNHNVRDVLDIQGAQALEVYLDVQTF